MHYKLVFVLQNWNNIGFKLEGRAVEFLENGELSLSSTTVYLDKLNDYNINPSESVQKLFHLMDKLTIKELEKHFLPTAKKRKRKTLEEVLENRDTKNLVSKFIEEKLSKCFEIIVENELPLYFVENKRDEISESNQLHIEKEPLECTYYFKKETECISYKLLVAHQDQKINLIGKTGTIICNNPGWIKIGEKLYRTTENINGLRLLPFFKKDFITIPRDKELEFFKKIILPAIGSSNVEHEGFDIEKFDGTPYLLLTLDYHVLNQGYGLRAEVVYGEESFILNNAQKTKSQLKIENNEVTIFQTVRDFNWENETLEKLSALGLNKQGAAYLIPKNDLTDNHFPPLEFTYDYILRNKQSLDDFNVKIASTFNYAGKRVSIATPKLIKQTNATDYDWFDVHIVVEFKGFTIPFTSFKNHILNQDEFYQLPDNTHLLMPKEWFAQYKAMFELGTVAGDKLRLNKLHQGLLDFFDETPLESNEKFEVEQWLSSSPSYINAELRPYQLDGLNWLIQLNKNEIGGCLADDMGLGKTLQVISLLAYLKETEQSNLSPSSENSNQIQLSLFADEDEEEKHLPTLVVMPLSLLTNWFNEIKKFAPQLKTLIYSGAKRLEYIDRINDFDIILLTYNTLRNDVAIFKAFDFHYLILDESQAIKNPKSETFKAVSSINAMHRIAMTGTPIENTLTDLWAQFHFLNSGMLGTIDYFKDSFIQPINSGDEFVKHQLKKIITPLLLRREKEMVAKDLPDRSDFIFYSEMTLEQKNYYEEEKSKARNAILEFRESNTEEKGRNTIKVLATLTKLRQIANHPILADDNYTGDSGKFDDILEQLSNLNAKGHKVLVFSQYVKHLELFQDYFDEKNIPCNTLYGSHTKDKRKAEITDFQNENNNKLFLISLKAGGSGLNLVEADYVFILDPWWNPQIEEQAIARAHRIGQTKKVFTYRFISKDTLEEKIHELQIKKRNLATDILSDAAFIPFSDQEIDYLLE